MFTKVTNPRALARIHSTPFTSSNKNPLSPLFPSINPRFGSFVLVK